jgi:hypothetical protein
MTQPNKPAGSTTKCKGAVWTNWKQFGPMVGQVAYKMTQSIPPVIAKMGNGLAYHWLMNGASHLKMTQSIKPGGRARPRFGHARPRLEGHRGDSVNFQKLAKLGNLA